ncbi:S-methyl-5-thioribose-1-phosphate isomerase [Candidatus Atribacteria bacterium HGW-Atribacteria-1]|nr:MAG: S-methyl-5-thioribose-1-phosphate isomerase [Candidatus Atribacteria bacterium HGW-Atribacteria-1]
MQVLEPIRWDKVEKKLYVLNQLRLPITIEYLIKDTVEGVFYAIRHMEVRGAPLIGIVAAYGIVLGLNNLKSNESLFDNIKKNAEFLTKARPTAFNLFWALDRMQKRAIEIEKELSLPLEEKVRMIEEEAMKIHREDERINFQIGENFLNNLIVQDGDTILTHCNAGVLATSKYGTATSPMYLSKDRGWNIHVYVDETRPYLQGARLTAFELNEAGINVTLICDNMAGMILSKGKVNEIIVGADRIAANGDVANKIGTMPLAILAKHFGVPFYVAAPSTTVELACESGNNIPIEERDVNEVTNWFGIRIAPKGIDVYNPAFDITPHELITAIVTEKGIIKKPFVENIERTLKSGKMF